MVLLLVALAIAIIASKRSAPGDAGAIKASTPDGGMDSNDECAEIKQSFLASFSLLTSDRREKLIDHYMHKNGCNRCRAMQIALQDLRSDNVKFD